MVIILVNRLLCFLAELLIIIATVYSFIYAVVIGQSLFGTPWEGLIRVALIACTTTWRESLLLYFWLL